MAVVVGVVAGGGTAAAAIPIYTHPDLELARTIVTNPFPGTTMKPSDAEGLAYVPSDNSIWLADDNGHRLFEIDATSGALKRTLTQSTLAAAPQYPSGPAAGTNTASDWEAMTYDPVHDILYAFAGKCCSSGIRAAAFRFLRVNGVFQVDTFQPFSSPLNDFSGVGEINGEIWGALGKVLYKYDYVTNTFSNSFTVPGVSGSIYGISDSPGGAQDVWFTGSSSTLYRFNWVTRTMYPNHTFAMTPRGVRDARAVDVLNDQLIICDGYDSYSSSSPDRYAIKFFNVIDLDGTQPPAASFTATPATGPAPLAVQFTDNSTNNPTSWQWNFGDGGTSTQRNPSHTFAGGTFTVSLTATNANGSNSTTRTVTATVPQPPVASFTATPTSGPAPLAVQFTDTSANGPTSWAWNFGDGTSSTQRHPAHTFGTTGAYTVTLTATNASGSTSASTTINASGPLNSFPALKDAFVNPASATKNYGGYDYLRALAGSTQYRPYVAFNVSGLSGPVARAVIRLFVTDASDKGGDWYAVNPSWNETGLNWNNAPQPGGALLSSLGAVTANTWVEIDVTPAIAGNGTYSFAALTTSTNSLRYSSKEGANPPQLVITPGAGSTPPIAGFTASPTSGAAPLTVAFTDASTANTTSWAWDFGDGGTSNQQNPTHTFNGVGSFLVRLTASNAQGGNSITTTITTSAPTSNGTYPVTKDSIVSAGSPTKNYGAYDYIRGLLNPPDQYRPYVSFDVSGVGGTITRAVIRLFVTDGSDNGGAWYRVDPAAWSETALNWNNAPPLTGTPVASVGTVSAGNWIEVDVTSVVTGNGSYSFGAISTSSNSVRFSSKEGANPPQLVLTTT